MISVILLAIDEIGVYKIASHTSQKVRFGFEIALLSSNMRQQFFFKHLSREKCQCIFIHVIVFLHQISYKGQTTLLVGDDQTFSRSAQ